MDVVGGLIALGCILVLCLFGYLLVVYGITRRSYDDVMAEQRQRIKLVNKEKKEKKEKKKSNKKEKKALKESNQTIHPRVEFSELNEEPQEPIEEPILVQEETHPKATAVPQIKMKPEVKAAKKKQEVPKQKQPKTTDENSKAKSKKEDNSTTQKLNKNDNKVLEEEQANTEERKPEKPEPIVTEEAAKPQRQKPHKVVKTEQYQEATQECEDKKPVEEKPEQSASVEESSSTSPSPPPNELVSKQSRRKKQKIPKNLELVGEQLTSGILVQLLRTAFLDQNEIQMLIDTLLNKQNSVSNKWIERGQQRVESPVEIKKKLEEAENKFQTMVVKVRELRAELNNEKSKSTQMEKQCRDSLAKKQNEMTLLQTSIKRTTEHHAAQISQLKAQLQVHSSGKKSADENLARTLEENQQLKLILDQTKMQAQQREAEKLEIDSLCQKQAGQLQVLTVEIQQSQEQLGILSLKDEELSRLRQENENLSEQVSSAQMRADSHEAALEENAKEELDNARIEIRDKEVRIVGLREQLQYKDNQVADLESRLSAAAQQHDSDQQMVVRLQTDLSESSQKLKDSESASTQMQKCQDDISNLSVEVERLRAEALDRQGQLENRDGQLIEKGQLIDSLLKQVSDLKVNLEQKDGSIAVLKEELSKPVDGEAAKERDLHIESLKKIIEEKNTHIEALTNDNSVQRQRLQENNESIQCLSSQLETRGDVEEVRREEQLRAREAMQRLCPHIQLQDSDYECWMNNYIKAVSDEMKANQELQQQTQSKAAQLESSRLEQDRLGKEVVHYRTVLTETECMLSTLQASVDSAEKDWRAQVEKLLEEKQILIKEKLEAQETAQKIEASREMQEKLVELQRKLQGEEEEKKELASKYCEAHSACENLQIQIEEHRERTLQITEQLESVTNNNIELQKEKVKLSSQLNIGEAALKEEQETVQRLQKELALTKGATVNDSEQLTNGESHQPEVQESV